MKILDRYVLIAFLKNYLLSFLILVGLYVVLDMLFNFDEFMASQARDAAENVSTLGLLAKIGDYYFYQMFEIFAQLSGIIPVVATAFTLMRMSRFNELSAILSAGVPLLRVASPIILTAIVLQGLLLVDTEVVVPRMIPKLTRAHNEAGQAAGTSFPIPSMQDEANRVLVAGRYTPGPGTPVMLKVTIIERNDQLLPTGMLTADAARWQPDARDEWGGEWQLDGAVRTTGLLPDQRPATRPTDEAFRGSITPEEISLYRSNDYVQLLSAERINELLNPKRALSYGSNQLLRVKHSRFTQPLVNIILLLLAIPCVLTREPGRLKAAAVKCLVLTGLAMGSVFLAHMLAAQPPNPGLANQWPAVMAWVPIFLFGPISVLLLDRIES